MHSSNRVFPTIHDKGVPGLTPVINEVFMFKNDLHADLHTSTRCLNGPNSQVPIPVYELSTHWIWLKTHEGIILTVAALIMPLRRWLLWLEALCFSVVWIVVCTSHSHERPISEMPGGNFFKSKMSAQGWTDSFGGQVSRSKNRLMRDLWSLKVVVKTCEA